MRLKLIREGRLRYLPTKLTSSRSAFHFVSALQQSDRERFLSVLVDSRNQVIGAEEVAVGTVNKAVIMPAEVFKAALLCNAAALIIAHNHPSGDPKPSPEDVHLTHELRRSAKLLGLSVLDHIVVGESSYYSFADDQWPLGAHEVGIRGQARISAMPEGLVPHV